MEEELEIKSSLMAPPKKDMLSLTNAQLGFMNMFAIPLFQGVADLMPSMRYVVDELEINRQRFEKKATELKAAPQEDDIEQQRRRRDGTLSPRSMSLAVGMEEAGTSGADPNKNMDDMPGGGASMKALPTVPESRDALPIHTGRATDSTDHPRSVTVQGQPPMKVSSSHTGAGGSEKQQQQHNGTASHFAVTRDLPQSDPFRAGLDRGDGTIDGPKSSPTVRHRCSETTDGSVSGICVGDWQSQATSATTGKMPLSPSTQGTSIVSRDSLDQPPSVRGLSMSPPSVKSSPTTLKRDECSTNGDLESSSNGSTSKSEQRGDPKTLKKKTSRFRMKDFPFFRRNKASSPSMSNGDGTG